MATFNKALLASLLSFSITVFASNPPNTTQAEVEAQKTEFTLTVKSTQASQLFSGAIFVDGKVIKLAERTPYELKLKAQSVRYILSTDESQPRITVSVRAKEGTGFTATAHNFFDCAESTLSRQAHLKRYGSTLCEGSMAG